MNDLKPLSSFPPIVKLFVALFTTLMLVVTLWAVWIYAVDKSEANERPGTNALAPGDEIDAIASDSETVLAPIWDTNHAGEPERLDSSRIDTMESMSHLAEGYDGVGNDNGNGDVAESRLRHNLGLAHVYVNGQTLLFFALGGVFLFTSVKPRIKKTVLWLFAIAIVCNTAGLTGAGYHSFFGDLLAVSKVVLLALVVYMCVMIYVDLGKSAPKEE